MGARVGGYHTISTTEARSLGERRFRELFVRCVTELSEELQELFTANVDFDYRHPEDLSTSEMKQIVLRYQDWFDPLRSESQDDEEPPLDPASESKAKSSRRRTAGAQRRAR